jgi:hypothetical protein
MKILCFILIAVTVILPVGGREVLDYVSPDAKVVLYGNSQAFFLSKVWKILKRNNDFQTEVIPKMMFFVPFKDLSDFSGKFVIWANRSAPASVVVGGVITFDDAVAAQIFDRIRTLWQIEEKVKIFRQKGRPAFEVISNNGMKFSLVLVNSKEIHISAGGPGRIWSAARGKNRLACAIDPACAAALVTDGTLLTGKMIPEDKIGFDVSKIGISKLEAYIGKKQIRINATLDISEVN